MALEDLLEYLLKGTLVIAALVAGLAIVGVLAVAAIPIGVGLVFSFFIFKGEREAIARKKQEEHLQLMESLKRLKLEREERERQEQNEIARYRQELQEEEEEREREKQKRIRKEVKAGLHDSYYLERDLSKKQQEELFARKYKRIKLSPDGKSGASIYWVDRRFNESIEHAFFIHYIADLLEKRGVSKMGFSVTNGPDIEFEFKRKTYCIEVETGSNIVRDSVYVFRKLAFNQQNYHKCFVFVTKKKFKYRYSKMAGEIVTRATLKKTIADLGKS